MVQAFFEIHIQIVQFTWFDDISKENFITSTIKSPKHDLLKYEPCYLYDHKANPIFLEWLSLHLHAKYWIMNQTNSETFNLSETFRREEMNDLQRIPQSLSRIANNMVFELISLTQYNHVIRLCVIITQLRPIWQDSLQIDLPNVNHVHFNVYCDRWKRTTLVSVYRWMIMCYKWITWWWACAWINVYSKFYGTHRMIMLKGWSILWYSGV